MKFKLLLSFLLLLSLQGFSQLSQQATINYIDDKMNECADLRYTTSSTSFYRLAKIDFALLKDDNSKLIVNITQNNSDNTVDEIQYIFDPTHISSISYITASNDAVDLIAVQTTGKTVIKIIKKSGSFTESNENYFIVPYLNVDPLNKERIKKAFLLLKKYYVAKKGNDPFAN
jgi:hypothetical protein